MSEALDRKVESRASSHPCLKKAGIVLVILLAVGLLAFIFRAPILTGVANYLVDTDAPLQPADLIFVLNGDINTRPFYATDLYKQGLAPKVAIAKAESSPAVELGLVENVTDIAVQVMLLQGIPLQDLVVLQDNSPVTSTFDEAAALRRYIEANNIESLILVTSDFHTHRSRWILEKELAGLPVELQVAGAPHARFDESNWWRVENGLIFVNNEYIKTIFYWIKYR